MTAKIIKMPSKAAAPPRKLGKYGGELWRKINAEFSIEDAAGIELLLQACEALDRAQSLREQIDAQGEIIKTKAGLRDHPGLKHELANRAFVTRTLARLGLEFEPVRNIGRPASPLGWDGKDY